MESVFGSMFDQPLKDSGYKNNEEYIRDEIKVVDMMLTYYLNRLSGDDYFLMKDCALSDLKKAQNYINCRVKATDKDVLLIGNYFRKVYDLSDLEWFIVMVALASRYDFKIKKRLLKIDKTQYLEYASVFKLYFFVEELSEIEDYFKIYFPLTKKLKLFCFEGRYVKLEKRVFENIMSDGKKKMDIEGVSMIYPHGSEPLMIREELAEKACKFFENKPENQTAFCYVCGAYGIGKTSLMSRVCNKLGKCVVCVDISFITGGDFYKILKTACREASFLGGFICLRGLDKLIESEEKSDDHFAELIIDMVQKFTDSVFIFSDKSEKMMASIGDDYSITIKLDALDCEESFKCWDSELKKVKLAKDVSAHDMANKFTLTPLQIKRAVSQAVLEQNCGEGKALTAENLSDAAYAQITQKLGHQATVIKKKHTLDELVLPVPQKDALIRACNQIKYKHVVYDEWKLKNTILYGRGLSMLFTGPPGTGKTMAAQVIANELHLEIYRVDLSQIVSKYIGETEKNLAEIFDSAKKSNVILLFDETDALFGKRTEVKDSHDKHANLETAYLLQKMEEYDGITIMTTNLSENLDNAFFRRISYVVHFPLPDEKSRKMIWQKIYPKEAPLSQDVDFDFLAKKFEISGGNIKNVVITSTFMAASEGKKIEMKHILKAIEYEIKKQGKMISKNDFGEYAYLL